MPHKQEDISKGLLVGALGGSGDRSAGGLVMACHTKRRGSFVVVGVCQGRGVIPRSEGIDRGWDRNRGWRGDRLCRGGAGDWARISHDLIHGAAFGALAGAALGGIDAAGGVGLKMGNVKISPELIKALVRSGEVMPAALAVGIGLETTEGVLTDLIGDMLGDGVILTNHGVRRKFDDPSLPRCDPGSQGPPCGVLPPAP